MPRGTRFRPGPVGIAIALFDVWQRLPPKQRKQALALARRHGPTAAAKIYALRRYSRRRP